ncbi:uncharacterized protein LOC111891079 [Lactuca sativa]|uniref:uncharacterized protein LOC111891079 n=1 Tax=Lactuca sativa TaxID=4236 RepID=UPI000CD99A29|nr:uncharacterized protein LOC111891079 [Lactuca sativa]
MKLGESLEEKVEELNRDDVKFHHLLKKGRNFHPNLKVEDHLQKIEENHFHKNEEEYEDLHLEVVDIPKDEKDKLISNAKVVRIIRFASPADIVCLVSSCETAKEIWYRHRELYSSDADLEHSIQTLLLLEFGAFVQKPEEKLDQTFNRYNHLLSGMVKHKIKRELIEQRVTFMNGLRSEWKVMVSTVKAHKQFKNYSLAKLVGILRSHEDEVTSEGKFVSSIGSLAVVAKGKKVDDDGSESDLSDCELSKADYAMMVSDPMRFAKKNFGCNKNQNWQGSYSSEKVKDESANNSQKEKTKKEKKFVGESGYYCNYFHGKNHLANECMLRRMNEKKEEEDDEAYLLIKLEEIKKKKSVDDVKPALTVQEQDDEFGRVEVWATDSEDGEVHKPTHGRSFVEKGDVSQSNARYCMVTNEVSELRGYATEGVRVFDNFFAPKLVPVQINECEKVINKLHLGCEIGKKIHNMILPFLELKKDEIDADCYKCESIVSSDKVSEAYRIGLEKMESYIQSKYHKNMLKQILDENDKKKIKYYIVQMFDSLNTNLSSESKLDVENTFEFDDNSDMCEISVEDEVDCSEFVKSEPEPTKVLISENSVEFARFSEVKSKVLKEKATVFRELIRDKQFDFEWYINSGCWRHMTGRKEELREFKALKDGGRVKFGNNSLGEIKGLWNDHKWGLYHSQSRIRGRCFIFNSKEQRNKFDAKTDEGIFLGYSLTLKAYQILNKISKGIEETYYVAFDGTYLKKYQKVDSRSEEIFPSKIQ